MNTGTGLLRSELSTLLDHQADWCVSLFQPTHRAGAEVAQNPIRLKNLLKTAEERLVEAGARRTAAQALLAPAHDLIPRADFWRHQGDGLALFLAPGWFRQLRVPLSLKELVVVGQRFEIKPLLPLLTGDGQFYILALSQNQNRLLLATRDSVREVDTPGVPASLAEALKFDDPERQLQFHSRTAAPSRQGRRAAIFHGHGAAAEDGKTNLLRYCQKVDRGLQDVLRDEQAPLVLAAVEFEQAIYREANTYPHLLPVGVSGNPELASPDELRREAWAIVEPHFRAAQEAAARAYRELRANGRTAGTIETVLPAAVQGRIHTLFAVRGREIWGRFDPDSLELRLHDGSGAPMPGERDLLDVAARITLGRGGTVYVVEPGEMPDGGEVAAVLRF